jgi:uncharacterized membrane protein YvlD (DUF360 family)
MNPLKIIPVAFIVGAVICGLVFRAWICAALCLVLAYCLRDEGFQQRPYEADDFFADAVGCVLMAIMVWLLICH